jgi:hypothetical protein
MATSRWDRTATRRNTERCCTVGLPGPEDALAGHPVTLVTVILVQIVITMWAVWWGAGNVPTEFGSIRDENMSHAERASDVGFVER